MCWQQWRHVAIYAPSLLLQRSRIVVINVHEDAIANQPAGFESNGSVTTNPNTNKLRNRTFEKHLGFLN